MAESQIQPMSKMQVAFQRAALEGLDPLLKAMDQNVASVPLEIWQATVDHVSKVIAEVHFGCNDQMNTLENKENKE